MSGETVEDTTEGTSEGETPEAPPSRNPIKRLYRWVLHWAETPYGTPALAGISFAESSFFPIPPDPLLVALALGQPKKSMRFALVCTLASVVGGIVGYGIGALAWDVMGDFFFSTVPGVTPDKFETVEGWFNRWGFWAVFLAGLTPMPYKVFTLASGVFAINFPIFVIASGISRGLRFGIEGALIYFFGEPIGEFIDKYFNLLMWLFGALLIGGFLLVGAVM